MKFPPPVALLGLGGLLCAVSLVYGSVWLAVAVVLVLAGLLLGLVLLVLEIGVVAGALLGRC